MNRLSRILIALLLGATAACSSSAKTTVRNDVSAQSLSIANGRLIFDTGKDTNGVRITAHPRALKTSCAACHRPDGAGGIHLAANVVSADLRHKAFAADPHHPYTLPLVERAVATGIDNDGDALSPAMPRWRLSKRDLHDVAYYVMTQLK